MSDSPPPRPVLPTGPVQHAHFGGVLRARIGDPSATEAALQKLRALNLVPVDYEADRARFALYFGGEVVPGKKLGPKANRNLLQGLQDLLDSSPDPESAESTLHATEVYADAVVETLFAIQKGAITCVSNPRNLEPGDALDAPERKGILHSIAPSLGTKAKALCALLLVLAAGLFAWEKGWMNRLFAEPAAQLSVESGDFEGWLSLQAKSQWGTYRLQVQRGPNYPTDPEQVRRQLAALTSTVQSAALSAIAEGRTIFVQCLDDEAQPLSASPIPLAALLTSANPIVANLPGHPKARTLRLSLAPAGSGPR